MTDLQRADKKLRVLEICFSGSRGGLEMYMANVSRWLHERGHDVVTVAPRGSYLEEKLAASELPFFAVAPGRRYLDFRCADQVAGIIAEHEIDIIHAHQSRDLSTLIVAKKKAGRGKIVFTQQMESARKKKDLFHRWVYGNLDGLIAITDRIRSQVRQNTTLPSNRLDRLYYGIDIDRFKPDARQYRLSRERFAIRENEIAVGIVGRLEEGKGQHILLKAFSGLREDLPPVKVMIIGSETAGQSGYENHLRQMVKDYGSEDRVIFTGFQEDVPSVSAALDVVVLATRKETFGLSLIECMAQEIAPLATNAGGVPEIIMNGENGLLVEPFNPLALQKALERLIGDAAYRKRLAASARRTVEEKFNLSQHLTGLEKIFSHVITG